MLVSVSHNTQYDIAYKHNFVGQDGEESVFGPKIPSDNKDRKDFGKIGRNDPCHCGSGKKYKKCAMVNLCTKN